MRLPFPERIPLKTAAVFASILFIVQQIQGTEPYFSLCAFLFVFLAAVAFNLAGGFTRPSGGYIFFYATLTCIVGWVVKACLGEAADSNLLRPNLTVSVFVGGIAAMAAAVLLSRKITTSRKALLGNFLTENNTPAVVVGCTLVGIGVYLLENIVSHGDGSLISLLHQTNVWAPLAIVIGVTYEIRRSGGTRSLNATVLVAGACTFILSGLINFSKEGLFTPIVCYLLAACSMHYRLSRKQMVGGVIILAFTLLFLVPYSQYGRNFRAEGSAVSQASFKNNVAAATALIADLGTVRSDYLERVAEEQENGAQNYFNTDQGLFSRLTMLGPDDALIDATEQGRSRYGLLPLAYAFENTVPHSIWPSKPNFTFGNLYAHEIGGMIDEEDFTTGISFSPTGEAYHMARWFGVLFIAPLIWCGFFTIVDLLCGDTRNSPWGLLLIAHLAHAAPEGMLEGPIGTAARFGVGLVVAAFACAYVMPILGGLVIGPQRQRRLLNATQQGRGNALTHRTYR